MKKIFLMAICLFMLNRINAQILHPVKWSYGSKKTGNNEAVLFFKATIENGWHIYSVNQKDGGPVKTSFIFNPATGYSLAGNIHEPIPVTKYEKSFAINVSYFLNTVTFQQKIKLTTNHPIVKGTLNFMVCNDQRCLPPEDVEFSILLK
jgi:DsbC/DsbD-like thiol-disulfide interchange protein